MSQAQTSELVETVLSTASPKASWEALAAGLNALGLDQINYAFLDMAAHEQLNTRAEPFMATMRQDWIDHYVDRQYDLVDDLVDHVKYGGIAPRLYDFNRAETFAAPVYANEAREAGLKTGLVIPLFGDPALARVTAGIMFGSSLPPTETTRILRDNAAALTALAHVFHAGMIGEFRRQSAGAKPLTAREKDCLQMAASGLRTTAIAHQLGVTDSTVGLHLTNARRKLGATSIPEAVARALKFQQIVVA